MEAKLQKKISISKILGGKPSLKALLAYTAETGKADMPLCRIYGAASGTKTGVSDFGEWTALTGQFRGVNTATGETIDSGVCFLPDVALDLVVGVLVPGATVEFAFDIAIRADESSATGYIYLATPLVSEAESAISRLENKLKALAAPAAADRADAEKAGKKAK